MRFASVCGKAFRFGWLSLAGLGGILFVVVPGCEPEWTRAFFDGLEAGLGIALPTIFDTLTQDLPSSETPTDTVPTVLLDTLQHLARMLA